MTGERTKRVRASLARACAAVLAAALLVCSSPLPAQEEAVAGGPRVVVRLVTSDGRLISDIESLHPVTRPVAVGAETRLVVLGERCTLWVRNASVDGKFRFERYHEGKYVGRRAELSVESAALGAGEHVINPGAHKFRLDENGRLASDDPEIQIKDNVVSLCCHRVDVFPVDGGRKGPPESRLVPARLGLVMPDPEFKAPPVKEGEQAAAVNDGSVVEPGNLLDVQKMQNLLSHSRDFYPLAVYLPSNTVGYGYCLYPSWQTFRLLPGGRLDISGAKPYRVPGVEVEGGRIVINCRRIQGVTSTRAGLVAALGSVMLKGETFLSPTAEALRFRAGAEEPDESFFLPVDNDLSKNPHKYLVADNATDDPKAVRLMALEWADNVLERGRKASMSLRFLESPGMQTVKRPTVRMSWSRYLPSSPSERRWQDMGPVEWKDGVLTFAVPQLDYDFYHFRVMVLDGEGRARESGLNAEFMACVAAPGQSGTASFITNKGRNAFVAGESIRALAVIRSARKRQAGQKEVMLTHPDGHVERIPLKDGGGEWFVQALVIPAEVTQNLQPGRYVLSFAGLPPEIGVLPLAVDLVSDQKASLYQVIKPSKYTGAMTGLIPSHYESREEPVDLDRAMDSLAEVGYNRVDHHCYLTHVAARPHTEREEMAAADERLMAPESVYAPCPRDQMLNACVRNRMDFCDVLLPYGDHHLPRYIEPYIEAAKRWARRDVTAMRHSPAFDGLLLYDEMYDQAAVGLRDVHQTLWPRVRAERARQELGKDPGKIRSAMSRYVARPKAQRQPEDMEDFLRLGRFDRHSWGDFNTAVADAAREVAPRARIGTYHRTWMTLGSAFGLMNGYIPDVFENLDFCAHIHYADNMTNWVHSCMMAQALRFGAKRKPVWVNIPMHHEAFVRHSGEYARQMAFAMLAQGADGVSMYGLAQSFENGPNPGSMAVKESIAHLNERVLAPFGELVSRTEPGYQGVGIVITLNQFLLDEFKRIGTANMAEELWVSCWRLGYPATFLYEDSFERSVDRFQVIFVPNIRFEGELGPRIVERLSQAIRAGTKVVVERDSALDIPGVIRWDDMALLSFYLQNFFPTWIDEELGQVYAKSQATTELLAQKLPALGVEPAARGPFKVGPNWRSSGDFNYLIMANFEDPAYAYTIKQHEVKPVRMPLSVPTRRGSVAYDLLAQKRLPLQAQGRDVSFELDMTELAGAMVAFVPEEIRRLDVTLETTADGRCARLSGALVGASGKPLKGVFPARMRLRGEQGEVQQEFFRALGEQTGFEFHVPASSTGRKLALEVRECVSGLTTSVELPRPAAVTPSVRLVDAGQVHVPYPAEVRRFLSENKRAALVVFAQPGMKEAAQKLVAALKGRGMEVTVKDEMSIYRIPTEGDPGKPDPLEDGFHTWHSSAEVIQPGTVVDEPLIVMAGKDTSFLLGELGRHGFLTEMRAGGPGLPVQPSIQVARSGLHWKHDTLCLVANDAAGMRQAVDALLGALPEPAAQPAPAYAEKKAVGGATSTSMQTIFEVLGNNEQVQDIQSDRAGNLYVLTWGHGCSLYSLDASGKLRFARHLPQSAAGRMDVLEDRVLAFTQAGSRLYELTLDGKPMLQARLSRDLGPVVENDGYGLSWVDYAYLPQRRQVLVNVGPMRVFDEEGRIVSEWTGESYADKDVNDRIMKRVPRAFVLSPDRTRIAQIETSEYFTKWDYMDQLVYDFHVVMRDLDGKLLAEHKNVGNSLKADAVSLQWPANVPGPLVFGKDYVMRFDEKLALLENRPFNAGVFRFGGLRRLARDGNTLIYADGDAEVSSIGPLDVMPSVAALSPDGRFIALLDEYGLLTVWEAASGRQLGKATAPQLGLVLRFTADSSAVLLGGLRGDVMKYGLDGSAVWRMPLRSCNNMRVDPPLYDASIKDITDKLWPTQRDRPGELDEMVRMGENRLVNGDFEGKGGWQGDSVVVEKGGCNSANCLKVGSDTVWQETTRYLGNHVTWVLEFFYRSADPQGAGAELIAGIHVDSKHPDSAARRFKASAQWQFGRLVVKSGRDCSALRVGLAAVRNAAQDQPAREVLVDSVTLRQVRFPSTNLLHYEPLYEVEPIILTNPLFSTDYDPPGDLRLQGPAVLTLVPYGSGGKPMAEPVFLHNGRINDMSSYWYEQQPTRETTGIPITLTLKEPRWVSLIALFFNYYDEENATPHFDVYATDLDKNAEVLVASVRNNTQAFRLLKFSPIRTTQVKVRLVDSVQRHRTLTEIEFYGPLSGREVAVGFTDPEGQNTYMGGFARVDKRPKALADLYRPPFMRRHGHDEGEMLWAVPAAQIMAAEDKLYVTRALGYGEMYEMSDMAHQKSRSRAGSLGFSPHVTLYGGLLLKCGLDGQLYCIDGASSRQLWSVKVGGRLVGAPVASESDVLIAAGADGGGKLYKLDLANGSVMMEAALSGVANGSLAMDGGRLYVITLDGFVQALDPADGRKLWAVAIATDTESTPAVDGGVVYLADRAGKAMALRATDGAPVWATELGQEFARCPVVLPGHVIFGCRHGKLAVLNRANGQVLWQQQVRSRFDYEPLVLSSSGGDQVLYFEDGAAMLTPLAGGAARRLQFKQPKGKDEFEMRDFSIGSDPIAPLTYYKGHLMFTPRHNEYGHEVFYVNFPWHPVGGTFFVLSPEGKEEKK